MKIIRQKGQVALIVLVISALALTLGLSLSDKIRSGVKISKDDELLQKAFDAAESTLEIIMPDKKRHIHLRLMMLLVVCQLVQL